MLIYKPCCLSVPLAYGQMPKALEPLLGSRTRALFYIWSGLTPIGDDTTELAQVLASNRCMNTWNQEHPFESIDIQQAQQFCMEQYAPDVVYTPLQLWLQTPTLRHRPPSGETHEENSTPK